MTAGTATKMRTVKAVLIDAVEMTVKDVEIRPTLETYYAMLECDCVQVISLRAEGDTDDLMVDESGAIKNPTHFFSIEPHWPGPLRGNGLIIGCPDRHGDETDA